VKLALPTCIVRSWTPGDIESLTRYADSRSVWVNLRDAFPHPYTAKDARGFIRRAMAMRPETVFAIEVDGAAVGGIGYIPQSDVNRVSAEVGYWLGEPYRGRGITTEALIAVTAHAIAAHHLTRLFALPFAHNTASCRVLEKAGYTIEGVLRRAAIKEGVVLDQVQYAFIAPAAAAS
jgi:[ribosomal protein S5]-alanine N-acetyltransferase